MSELKTEYGTPTTADMGEGVPSPPPFSPPPPPSPEADRPPTSDEIGAAIITAQRALHRLVSQNLVKALHALPAAATKGWQFQTPRVEVLDPLSNAAHAVVARVRDGGCSALTAVDLATANDTNSGAAAARVSATAAALCDANGRFPLNEIGSGEEEGCDLAAEAIKYARVAGGELYPRRNAARQ